MTNIVIDVVNYSYDAQSQTGTVTAIIEDFRVVYPETYEDPCEMGPALCEAEFSLNEDDDDIPTDESELEIFFQDLDLDWREVDQSDYYDD
jgi:hypothetical protein